MLTSLQFFPLHALQTAFMQGLPTLQAYEGMPFPPNCQLKEHGNSTFDAIYSTNCAGQTTCHYLLRALFEIVPEQKLYLMLSPAEEADQVCLRP